MRSCPTCERSWADAAVFCGACGAALVPLAAAADDADRGSTRRWRWVAPAVVAATAIAVAAAVGPLTGPADDAVDAGGGGVALPSEPAAPAPPTTPDRLAPARCVGPAARDCIAWRRSLPEEARSFPRVSADGRAIVLPSEETLEVVDADTGRTRWTREAPPGQVVAVTAATVLVSEGPADQEGISALSLDDGEVAWRDDTVHVSGGPRQVPQGSVLALAAIEGAPQGHALQLVALDAATGERRWQWDPPWDGVAEEFAHVVDGGAGVLVTGHGNIARVDLATGRTTWVVRDVMTREQGLSPLGDRVAIHEPSASPRIADVVLDLETGERVPPPPPGPRVEDGDLVLTVQQRRLTATDAATGEDRWSRPAEDGLQPANVVQAVPGRTIAASGPDPVVATVRGDRGLVGLDRSTGATLWSTGTSEEQAFMLVAGDHVVENRRASITVLARADGHVLAAIEGDGMGLLTPDPVLLVDGQRRLVRVDTDDDG